MGVIRQLRNYFTKQNIYPQTVEQAIYDTEGRRLDNKLANGVANPNLLINADFRNPINQRGKSSYNHEYCIDRWIASSTSTVTVKDGCIGATTTNANTFIYQKIEFPKSYIGRTLTLTFSTSNGLYSITKTIPNQFDDLNHQWFGEERDGVCASVYIFSENALCFTLECMNTNGGNIDIYWAKLEEGEIATPFRPRLYAEELALCQRYYQKIQTNRHFMGYGATGGSNFIVDLPISTPLRVTPTVSFDNNGSVSRLAFQGTFYNWETVYGNGITLRGVYWKVDNDPSLSIGFDVTTSELKNLVSKNFLCIVGVIVTLDAEL